MSLCPLSKLKPMALRFLSLLWVMAKRFCMNFTNKPNIKLMKGMKLLKNLPNKKKRDSKFNFRKNSKYSTNPKFSNNKKIDEKFLERMVSWIRRRNLKKTLKKEWLNNQWNIVTFKKERFYMKKIWQVWSRKRKR